MPLILDVSVHSAQLLYPIWFNSFYTSDKSNAWTLSSIFKRISTILLKGKKNKNLIRFIWDRFRNNVQCVSK